MVKHLHDYEVSEEEKVKYAFDPIQEADRLLQLSCANKDNLFEIFKETREAVHRINEELEKDNFKKAICHCNLNTSNVLHGNRASDDTLHLSAFSRSNL